MAGTATPATTACTRANIPFTVHEYPHDPRSAAYGDEAVEHLTTRLAVAPPQIFKTLVVAVPGGLAVAVLPVPSQLSLKAAARALGVGKASMAERAAVERATGYVFGGVSPLGQRKRLPTVVDASATEWERVLVSAGRRGLEVELAPADLVRLTDAVTAHVTAD
ncbi:aminoacyl-tRNA deacylase [Rhodococcus sp. HNM0569]|uniref:aminoacyl-tRNA deacylase n=1 Tax=Rhodococcus sp. HNM0569 TaxID=2716340 RepID=UPI00146DE0C7|nr:aminoacyl-tRNA deacylase [Rhodococcus sp. HNM0569]NLU81932.1 aminoacyl-tRNA deacylase [Rhodococcus sp. HNM0569]